MTAKQAAFVREYLVDLNATQAAIRAGYASSHAKQYASELMAKPHVQAAVEAGLSDRAERVEVTADQVLRELVNVAFSDPRDVMTWGPSGVVLVDSGTLTRDQAALVSEVRETVTQHGGTIAAKTHDRLAALRLIAQHLGMLKDVHEHTGKDGEPLEVTITRRVVQADGDN